MKATFFQRKKCTIQAVAKVLSRYCNTFTADNECLQQPQLVKVIIIKLHEKKYPDILTI